MIRQALIVVAAAALAGCDNAAEPEAEACVTPAFAQTAEPGSYMGQRERASICVKRAAFELTRKGGPLTPIAAAAMAQCAAEEADVYTALAKTGPVYDYQRTQLHEVFFHAAERAAVQARAIGCGRKPGEKGDTVYSE